MASLAVLTGAARAQTSTKPTELVVAALGGALGNTLKESVAGSRQCSTSSHEVAAIHVQGCAGHVTRLIGGEEAHG